MKRLTLTLIAVALLSFKSATHKTANATTGSLKPVYANAINTEKSNPLTPDSVIALLKSGNRRFYTFKSLPIDNRARIRLTATGQHPMGAVLSCLDSRVPVETVFNMGIGDLFVARVAGNIGNVDIWGSLEYREKEDHHDGKKLTEQLLTRLHAEGLILDTANAEHQVHVAQPHCDPSQFCSRHGMRRAAWLTPSAKTPQ